MELNNRIFDDECNRPAPENLRTTRYLVQNGFSVTEIRKWFPIYKTEGERYVNNN